MKGSTMKKILGFKMPGSCAVFAATCVHLIPPIRSDWIRLSLKTGRKTSDNWKVALKNNKLLLPFIIMPNMEFTLGQHFCRAVPISFLIMVISDPVGV